MRSLDLMNFTTLIGVAGGLTLVIGAAAPDRAHVKPIESRKNWLLALGALVMLVYSTLNYLAGGTVFFIFLQGLVILASAFMMLNVSDRIDTPIIALATIALIAWSLWIQPDLSTLPFILGLAGIAIGYCSEGGTPHREIALLIGSILIAAFSYRESNWVFFWLNVFFALFSARELLLIKEHQRG